MVVVTLPWPPTINTYWRRNGSTYFIAKPGIDFRNETIIRCKDFKHAFKPHQKLSVLIECYPPDKRKRDLDNLTKGILDALGKKAAHVYEDDNQIDKLVLWRCMPMTGIVVVTIDEI